MILATRGLTTLLLGLGLAIGTGMTLGGCGGDGGGGTVTTPCNGECPVEQCIGGTCITPGDTGDDADDADVQPDVPPDTPPDVPPDTPDADTDVRDTDDADADDADTNDADDTGDVEDADVPAPMFEESCLFEALQCHGQEPVPTLCTIRPEPDPLLVDVRFEGGLESRAIRPDRTYTVDVNRDGEACMTMRALEAGRDPDSLEIITPDDTTFRVEHAFGTTTITCPDDSTEEWSEDVVRSWLPAIWSRSDDICEEIEPPDCSLDSTCLAEDGETECCLTAGTGRCADNGTCPETLPQAVYPFESCIAETLGCFGVGREPLSCSINENTDRSEYTYSGDRTAVVVGDGFDNFTLVATNEGANCFTARFAGRGGYDDLRVTNPDTGDSFAVAFDAETVTVTCPDDSEEQLPRLAVAQHLPEILSERHPLCEVDELVPCQGDEECGEQACCRTFDGDRCINVLNDECPVVEDFWRASCLYPLFECFGADNDLAACIDFDPRDRTEVTYTSGSGAVFFNSLGEPSRVTSDGDVDCFQATGDNDNGYFIQDLNNGETFRIEFVANTAQIVCPDDRLDTVPRQTVLSYLPTRPFPDACDDPPRDDLCQDDPECVEMVGDGAVCCDVGNQNRCLTAEACEQFTPRTLCDARDQCGEGEECCTIAPVRVCDPAVCGDQVCCNLQQASACGTLEECTEVEDICTQEPDSCQDGQCCATTRGLRCLEGDCPDLGELWPNNCLFDTLNCAGDEFELDICILDEELSFFDATYESGARARFFEEEGQQVIRTGFGETQCYEARSTEDGYVVVDSRTAEVFQVVVDGELTRVTCPGDAVEIAQTTDVTAHIPETPRPDLCADSDQTWQASCLFDVFECFGADRTLDACVDWGEIGIFEASYDGGREVTFYEHDGRTGRVSGFLGLDCFVAQEVEGGVRVTDAANGDLFRVTYEGDIARIACPNADTYEVSRETIEAYLPAVPGPDDGCEDAERFDECQADPVCRDIDDALQCCDTGDRNACLPAESCRGNIPRQTCASDDGCSDGNVCCTIEPVRVCNPQVCRGDLCCNVPAAQVCATANECLGVFDDCDEDDVDACGDAAQCCPTQNGLRCIDGDSCPEEQDPIQATCLADTLLCFGRDNELAMCVEYEGLEVYDASYESGASASFFTQYGQGAARTTFGLAECYDIVTTDTGYTLQDLSSGDSYLVEIDGDFANIECPDATVDQATVTALSRWLPMAPDPGVCSAAERNDQCTDNQTCTDIDERFRCCDEGDSNICSPADSCVRNTPRTLCEDGANCGDGEVCCNLAPVRVCDPSLCGTEICCNLPAANVCATQAECNGIFDHCNVDNPDACLDGELCCETIEGNRCSPGPECEPLRDPIADTCIGSTLGCFGRNRTLNTCLSYNDTQIGVVVADFEGDVSARYFSRFGSPARRTFTGQQGCFDAVDTQGGWDVTDVISGDDFSIVIDGETATITCPDDSTADVPAAAVRAYFPQAPERELCEIPDDGFSCVFDGDCEQLDPQLGCCNTGDDFTCLSDAGCFRNSERVICDGSDNGCGQGQGCCNFEQARVCDPEICGDEICCSTSNQLVCADGDECRGIFDHCNDNSPESCGEGALCCDTLEGSRCLVNLDTCPPVQDPIQASCLFDTLSCFGQPGEVDSCEVRTNLGYLEASYESGGVGRFFTHLGLDSVRAENGEPCYDAATADDGTILLTNLLTRQQYRVGIDGDEATIVCPDDSMDIVDAGQLQTYLPARPPVEDCTETERNDVCADSDECMDLDDSLRCCNAGDRNLCLTPESCYRNTSRTTCAVDAHCGEGTQCCNAGPVRVCNPAVCGDAICCNVEQSDVCLTADECNGVYDLCDMDNPDCEQGSLCCDTLEGTRCIVGETCPEPVDPIDDTCLAGVFSCTGSDLELDSCTEYGELDVKVATYASGAELRFYTHLGRATRQARFEENLCYYAAEIGEDGGFDITGADESEYQVFFDGDDATILCPDNSRDTVPRAAILSYLTTAPADNACDPFQRNDACNGHEVCSQQNETFICCDAGDGNACLPGDGCAVNIPRATCDVNDHCGDGEVCCPQMPTRVCNPSLCGDAICCNVSEANICATQSECNGVVDVCSNDDPESCSDATQCCATVRGARCLAVDTCPVIDDPVVDSCLFDTLQCAGRDLEFDSCVDLGDLGLTRVSYSDATVATFFRRDGVEGRRVTAGGNLDCYDAVELPDGAGFALTNLVTGDAFNVEYAGENANVTCADDSSETIPRDALTAYLPARPSADACLEGVADECSVNADCAELDPTLVCCEGAGDGRRCLSAGACADFQARPLCNDDSQCGEDFCCSVAPARICDPTICGNALCCNVPEAQVCAGEGVCNGFVDHCDLNDQDTCPGNQLCCESVGGTRCIPGNECPEPQNPIVGTCLEGALECFGADHVRDSCTAWPGDEVDYVTYDGDAYVSFFTHLGLPSRRAGRGEVSCFEVYDDGVNGLRLNSLADGETHRIEFVGQFARVTCADEQIHSIPRPAVDAYLPPRPLPENCAPGERNDLCVDDGACRQIDDQLRCCDLGDGNDCLTSEGCYQQSVRQICDADEQCGEGTVCCDLAPVRVCNPSICGEDICCSIPGGSVCATGDECNGIVDLCEIDNPDTCIDGEVCCETLEGSRCQVGVVCPEPPDPVLATCLGSVLSCFGPDRDVVECVDHDEIGVLDGTYDAGVSARFFTHYGADAVRAGDGNIDCYDAITTDTGYDIHNLLADETFVVELGESDVTITCADDTVQTVSRAAFARYLPTPPNAPDCGAPERVDLCDNNSDCEQIDAQLRCCDAGDGNQCLTLEGCFNASPRTTCSDDADCGNGAFCCERGPVRVCNPRLCDGALCCNVEREPICGSESECNDIFDICQPVGDLSCPQNEQCCDTSQGQRCFVGDECPVPEDPVVSTCLGDAFQCFGRAGNLNSCDHWDFGTTEALFEGGGRVRFYTELGVQSRRARRGEVDCFDAAGSEANGFAIHDLINDETLSIVFDGPVARITCADNTEETVPREDALAYLPARPFPDACDAGEPLRGCADNAECRDLQQGLVCCDLGDVTSCTTAEDCFQSQPRTVCDTDENCSDGQTCCGFSPARICDPTVCGDDLCCNLDSEQVCDTADACLGIVDLCADNDPGSCANGELCCPTQVGTRCVLGDECPEPPDPVDDTCLAATLGCFGRDNGAGACVDYGETGVQDVNYDDTGAVARHYVSYGVETTRATRDNVDCYTIHALEGGVEIEDLNSGETYTVSLLDNNATILCPDDTEESVARGALEAWLPARPDENDCVPADRDDLCIADNECPDGETEEVCCDLGVNNQCTNYGSCVRNELRTTCGSDDDCGNGGTCCALEQVRVCDPELCDGEVCCFLENVDAACGTSDECNGRVDLCDLNRPSTCGGDLPLCCDTAEGNRCLVGPDCPEPPDPFADSCLFGTAQCQGRDLVQDACEDFGGIGIRSVSYANGTSIAYFTNSGDDARHVTGDLGECFRAVERTPGVFTIIDPEVEGTFVVDLRTDAATIQCPDDTLEQFDRDALLPYFPARPGGLCDDAQRDDECQQDVECSDIDPPTRCCDIGDQNICGAGETCVPNLVHATCDENSDCGDGTTCCPFQAVRVCDPSLCEGQTCCTINDALACGTEAECNGQFDFCDVNDPTTCDETIPMCCPTLLGARCLNVLECPEPPDPLEETCIFQTLTCPGSDLEVDSCEVWDALDITTASYVQGARGQFFESLGVPTRRLYDGDDQHCYTVRETGEDRLSVVDAITGEEYAIVFTELGAEITCPSQLVFEVPTSSVDRYLPTAPQPDTCGTAQPDEACQNDADCEQIDPSLGCCDLGDQTVCLDGGNCVDNTVHEACDIDNDNCAEGTQCCGFTSTRVCDPELCDGELCCTLSRDVCGTEDECNGVVDHCANDDDCGVGILCCPTDGGARCLGGDECPPEPDPLEGTCLFDTLACIGLEREVASCVDWSDVGFVEATFETGEMLAFYETFGEQQWRGRTDGVDCFEAIETVEPCDQVEDPGCEDQDIIRVTNLITEEVFVLNVEADVVTIDCAQEEDGEQLAPLGAVRAYLTDAPNNCQAPIRDNECGADADCRQNNPNEFCCDQGDANRCGLYDNCVTTQTRPTCGGDGDCGQGTMCCIMDSTRVCNPSLCDGDFCCQQTGVAVCATPQECNREIDLCRLNDPTTCNIENTTCCPTLGGNRCLEGECPELPDEVILSCIGDVLQCFGTDAEAQACMSFQGGDILRAEYGVQFSSYHFQRFGKDVVRTQNQGDCYELVEGENDGEFEVQDLQGEGMFGLTIGPEVTAVRCSDDSVEIVPSDQLLAYLPPLPDVQDCTPFDGNDECVDDEECVGETRCCSTGLETACLPWDDCVPVLPRQACDDTEQCGNNRMCCELETVTVCDPGICGDAICCQPEGGIQVCGSQAECNNIFDECDVQLSDCPNNNLCCETEIGARCLARQECPQPPDEVQDTCVWGTLTCFGRFNEVDSCEHWDNIDITTALYANGARAQFYSDAGTPAMYATDGDFDCFQAVTLQDGSVELLSFVEEGAPSYRIVFGEEFDTITCPEGLGEQQIPTGNLSAYLIDPPAPESCDAPTRNNQCEDDVTCQQIGREQTCCDAGDGNVCGSGQTCYADLPRTRCSDGANCAEGTVCCELPEVRVCDPGICGGNLCCGVEAAQVCATPDQCQGIVDLCDVNDGNTCAVGQSCCGTDSGNRCLVVDQCPEPEDPVAQSCIGDVLFCFGDETVLAECSEHATIGVTEASYDGEISATFFSRYGQSVRTTAFEDFPCFEAVDTGNGFVVNDLRDAGEYTIVYDGEDATVTCPDDTVETLPRARVEEFFPAAPNNCGAADRDDTCVSDPQCEQGLPGSVCCDLGHFSQCVAAQECEARQVKPLCETDEVCGDGLTCCGRATARVCDPVLCDGELCCDIAEVSTCEAREGECALADSCIAETLGCVGALAEVDACVHDDVLGITSADYRNGANAFFYTRLGRPARVTERDGNQCFRAVFDEGGQQYLIENLVNDETYVVTLQGQTVQVACPDNTTETVGAQAVLDVLSAAPSPDSCEAYERVNACVDGGDCEDDFGQDALCCDGGAGNLCSEANDDGCLLTEPRQQCGLNSECGEGEGCCALEEVRVCDPEICGDALCCFAPSARVCDTSCAVCAEDSDCDPGDVCCGFTNTCTAPEECEGDGTCDSDADCFVGSICCKVGVIDTCTLPLDCPEPCRSEDDCSDGRICCGSQDSPFGAYCGLPQECAPVENENCQQDNDCGQGQLCCRTQDTPSCTTADDCPVACDENADCGPGEECCPGGTRTPICVERGTCGKGRGATCAGNNECSQGLSCCTYDSLGRICIDSELCGGQIPPDPCADDPTICTQYPLAVCCSVDGEAICTDEEACGNPTFVCDQDTECGLAGSACCFDRVEPACYSWRELDSCGVQEEE